MTRIDTYGRLVERDFRLIGLLAVFLFGALCGFIGGVDTGRRMSDNIQANGATECEAALSAAEEWRDIAIATGLNAVDRTDAILTDAFGAKYTRAAGLQQIMGVTQ